LKKKKEGGEEKGNRMKEIEEKKVSISQKWTAANELGRNLPKKE